jgi:hypothetical protein
MEVSMSEIVNKTFFVTLPSNGQLYSKESPLCEGIVEMRYGTTAEEDILMNPQFVRRGTVFDKLLEKVIVDKSINVDDLTIGDRNTLIFASRQAMYGNKYNVQVTCPRCEVEDKHTVDLSQFKHFTLPDDVTENTFEFTFEETGTKFQYHIITYGEVKQLEETAKSMKKQRMGTGRITLNDRLVLQVDKINDLLQKSDIKTYIDVMSSIESQALRSDILNNTPDIDLSFEWECSDEENCGFHKDFNIEITEDFFWPAGRERDSRRNL